MEEGSNAQELDPTLSHTTTTTNTNTNTNKQGIPFMVLFGEDELAQGVVKVKDMSAKSEDVVPLDGLADELRRRIAAL